MHPFPKLPLFPNPAGTPVGIYAHPPARACAPPAAAAGAGHRPARIDYLLTSGRPLVAELALADTGLGFSYSDHLGVAAVLRFGGAGDTTTHTPRSGSGGGGGWRAPMGRSPGRAGSVPRDKGGAPGSDAAGAGAAPASPAGPPTGRSPKGRLTSQELQEQQEEEGDGQQVEPAHQAPASFTQLMQQRPAPFQHAAASIEAGAARMRRGRRQFVRLAAGLWAAGFGCLGALLARPWWQQCSDAAGASYVALLAGMGAAFGWAGVVHCMQRCHERAAMLVLLVGQLRDGDTC